MKIGLWSQAPSRPLAARTQQATYEELISGCWDALWRYAYRTTGNRDDAEDLLSETLVEGYRSFGQFRGDTAFTRWMYRIMTTTRIDMVRRSSRRKTDSLDTGTGEEGSATVREIPDPGSDPERIVLDLYREKFDVYSKPPKPEELMPETVAVQPSLSGPRDPNVEAASTVGRTEQALAPLAPQPPTGIDPAASPTSPFTGEVPETSAAIPASNLSGTIAGRDTADIKQKARWLLQLARDQMFRREFDAAERTIAEARTFKVKWGFFDETPDKLSAALTKARTKDIAGKPSTRIAGSTEPTTSLDADLPHDRRTARNALRDARSALNAGQTDRAEAIVRDLKTWDLRYSMFEDTPDKLSVAISEARRREASRSADLMVRTYLGNSSRPGAPMNKDVPPQVQSPDTEAPRPE